MKKILYVAMPFDGGKSGISRYIEKTLDRLSLESQLDLIMMQSDFSLIHMRINGVYDRLFLGQSNFWAKPILNIFFHNVVLPFFCLFKKYDYVFFPAGNRRFPFWFPLKTITMVHDFSHLHIPGKYDFFRHFYVTKVLPMFLKKASLIFTPSMSTKNDLIKLCGINEDKVRVNNLGFTPINVVNLLNSNRKNILYVSRVEYPGKNHVNLMKAYEHLCRHHSLEANLHLVGGDWNGAEEVHRYHADSEFKDRIYFLGHLSEEELEAEYWHASVFIYPSLYEGFGLPLLEAMSRGIPVISSNRGSLPEVGGDAVIYVNPEDVVEISDKLATLLKSDDLKEKYILLGHENLKRFSWESHTKNFP